jgi:hypothetical protein
VSGVVPDCVFQQPPPPEPDIVLDCPEGRLGIELTEIHSSGSEKRSRESEQDMLTESAKALYEQTGLPPVTVHIEWTDSPSLSKRGRRKAAQLLCDLVLQSRPNQGELSRDVEDGDNLLKPSLPIRALSVSWASSRLGSEWRDWNFHEVQPPRPGELQERIRFEEPKLDLSQWNYTSRWLVLVAGAAGPSTWTVLGAGLAGEVFRSRYDRVFLCLTDRAMAVELPLAQP